MSRTPGAGAVVAGVVLAGGHSRRMGRTKALIQVDGVAMADRVLASLRSIGADPLFVYGGDIDELSTLSAPVVPDEFPGEGPVGGVLGALTHLADTDRDTTDSDIAGDASSDDATFETVAGGIEAAFVLPCDVAMIDRATLSPLLDAFVEHRGRVVVARTDRMESMCAIWPIASRAEISLLFDAGERALHRVVQQLAHVEVDVDPQGLVNINTPDDLPG